MTTPEQKLLSTLRENSAEITKLALVLEAAQTLGEWGYAADALTGVVQALWDWWGAEKPSELMLTQAAPYHELLARATDCRRLSTAIAIPYSRTIPAGAGEIQSKHSVKKAACRKRKTGELNRPRLMDGAPR